MIPSPSAEAVGQRLDGFEFIDHSSNLGKRARCSQNILSATGGLLSECGVLRRLRTSEFEISVPLRLRKLHFNSTLIPIAMRRML